MQEVASEEYLDYQIEQGLEFYPIDEEASTQILKRAGTPIIEAFKALSPSQFTTSTLVEKKIVNNQEPRIF